MSRTVAAPLHGADRRSASRDAGPPALVVLGARDALLVTGAARSLAALPFLNAGTVALYRGTLAEDRSRPGAPQTLAWAASALRTAIAVDPEGAVARRNLSLALAANGDFAMARPAGRRGPRPHLGRRPARAVRRRAGVRGERRLGRRHRDLDRDRGRAAASQLRPPAQSRAGLGARHRGARLGGEGRRAGPPGRGRHHPGVARARRVDRRARSYASRRCWPPGGTVEYFARLQMARLYRLDGAAGRGARRAVPDAAEPARRAVRDRVRPPAPRP